jgi:hypothetical protein
MDWNFEVVRHIKNKRGEQMYYALFSLMDEFNVPLITSFVHSKSFEEVKPMLLALQHR